MATPIGSNVVTSIARRFILPSIVDQIYNSNIVLYRLMKMNRRVQYGGFQIEVPLIYSRFNTGGMYSGLAKWNTTPSDTVKNAAFDWKQAQIAWSVDGLTMVKMDQPEAIANFLLLQSTQASMEMGEILATSLFAPTTANPDDLDSIPQLIGTGATVGNVNYGGINRTANTWWNANVVAPGAGTAMSLAGLNAWFSNSLIGGHQFTLIMSGRDQYNRFLALNLTAGYSVQYVREPAGHDAMLASPGFTNALFNNVPWVVDSHVPSSIAVTGAVGGVAASDTAIYGLNENVLQWVVSPREDFYLRPFSEPVDQNAMVAALLVTCAFVSQSSRLHGAMYSTNA